MNTSDHFAFSLSKIAVSSILGDSGFSKTHSRCVDMLADVSGFYLMLISKSCISVAESANRSEATPFDLQMVFDHMNIDTVLLSEYLLANLSKKLVEESDSNVDANVTDPIQVDFPRPEPASFPVGN